MFRRLCALSVGTLRARRCYSGTAAARQSKFGNSGSVSRSSPSFPTSHTNMSSSSNAMRPGNGGTGAAGPMNLAQDSILLPETRAAMRDDTICLTEIIKKMSQLERQLQQQQQQQQRAGGEAGAAAQKNAVAAVSLKYLYNQLNPFVQEALSEKHDGLYNFLKQRKQYFLIIEKRSTDNVPAGGAAALPQRPGASSKGGISYYVQVNPLVKNKFLQRDVQKHTIKKMMGISENFSPPPKKRSNHSSSSNRAREGRGGRRGGGSGIGGGSRSDRGGRADARSQRDGRGFAGAAGGGGGGSGVKAGRRFGAPKAAWSSSYSSRGEDIAKGAMDEKVKDRFFGTGGSS